LGDSSWTDG